MERDDVKSALVHYLATPPRDGQSFDAYMREGLAHFPGLRPDDIDDAMRQAAAMCRRDAGRLLAEADALEARRCTSTT